MRWLLAGALVAAVLVSAVGLTAAAPVQTVPQQQMSCTWTRLPGTFTVPTMHMAYAYDTSNNALYTYGGLDRNNAAVSTVSKVDLSSGNPTSATIARVTVGGAQERYGAAGAYRPDRAGGMNGTLVWISGARHDGQGQSDVQVLDVATASQRSVTPSGSLQRVFGAAAYDPEHDVIVVHGGAKNCKPEHRATPTATPLAADGSSPEQAEACMGDRLPTQFLAVDAMSGNWSFSTGPSGGPNQVFGLTMVYDSANKRMLTFGGTTDETANPSAELWALDLSDPSLSNARWNRLSTGGAAPAARFFHAASYNAQMKSMIVAGGVTRNAFNPGTENTNDETFALDMNGATPTWMRLSGATVSDGPVGAAAGYSGNIMASLYAGGRRRFTTGTKNISPNAYYLNCQAAPTATATRTTGPTNTPGGPTNTPGGTMPSPTPTLVVGQVCDNIKNRVPAAAINAAVANPASVQGWGMLCNPSLPPSVWNQPRSWLSMRNPGVPYNPLFNSLVWSCGCP
jgi:hypothetical protein